MNTGFVYLWFDKKKKKYCLGSHYGSIDDGYVTSTGYMMKAYKKRPDDFKRRILEYSQGSKKELLEAEQKWLNMIKEEELFSSSNRNSKYYNIKKNASGLSGKIASDLRKAYYETDKGIEWRKHLSEKWSGENNPSKNRPENWSHPNLGKKMDNIGEGVKAAWKRGDFDHIDHSEVKRQMWKDGVYDNRKKGHRDINSYARGWTQSDYQKERVREANTGKIVSKETREKMSEKLRQRYKNSETCPNCGKIGSGPSMRRWHFSNCRN